MNLITIEEFERLPDTATIDDLKERIIYCLNPIELEVQI